MKKAKKTKRPKKDSLARSPVPAEWRKLWNKDFDFLSESQRISMTNIFVDHNEKAEYSNSTLKSMPAPYFMHQRDKIASYEKSKREKALKEKLEREEEQKRLNEQKEKELNVVKMHWKSTKIIKLSLEESLKLENIQLKLEIAENNINEIEKKYQSDMKKCRDKISNLNKELEDIGDFIGEKYEIDISKYNIDLVNRIAVRASNVEFNYSLDNMPSTSVIEEAKREVSKKLNRKRGE